MVPKFQKMSKNGPKLVQTWSKNDQIFHVSGLAGCCCCCCCSKIAIYYVRSLNTFVDCTSSPILTKSFLAVYLCVWHRYSWPASHFFVRGIREQYKKKQQQFQIKVICFFNSLFEEHQPGFSARVTVYEFQSRILVPARIIDIWWRRRPPWRRRH